MDDQSDNHNQQDEELTPSSQALSPRHQSFPGSIGKKIAVPEEIINAGRPTDLPRDVDSPETLDEDLSQTSDIEDIDKLNIPAYTGKDDDEEEADIDNSNSKYDE